MEVIATNQPKAPFVFIGCNFNVWALFKYCSKRGMSFPFQSIFFNKKTRQIVSCSGFTSGFMLMILHTYLFTLYVHLFLYFKLVYFNYFMIFWFCYFSIQGTQMISTPTRSLCLCYIYVIYGYTKPIKSQQEGLTVRETIPKPPFPQHSGHSLWQDGNDVNWLLKLFSCICIVFEMLPCNHTVNGSTCVTNH